MPIPPTPDQSQHMPPIPLTTPPPPPPTPTSTTSWLLTQTLYVLLFGVLLHFAYWFLYLTFVVCHCIWDDWTYERRNAQRQAAGLPALAPRYEYNEFYSDP